MLRFGLVVSAAYYAAAYSVPTAYSAARPAYCRRVAVPVASETDIEDIRWLPPIDPSAADVSEGYEPAEGATVMPLFPLGVTYIPYTTPVLNIFEPRYRAMYNDILFSGARRFMVCNVDSETGRLAETGVVFYLDELKEVSEQTADRVKYVGSHSVIGRVNLKKVLNPPVAATRETYLKAEVVELVDDDAGDSLEEEEAALKALFEDLVDVQGTLGEEPRFTAAVKATLSFGRGTPTTAAERQSGAAGSEDKGLWGTVVLWQQFLEQRASVVGQKMQRDIQKEVVTFLKSNTIESEKVNARGEMRLEDLPEELASEIRAIQRRYREELEASESDPYGLQFQALLQTNSHKKRLAVFRQIIETERKRLTARATLASMFKKDE